MSKRGAGGCYSVCGGLKTEEKKTKPERLERKYEKEERSYMYFYV